MEAYLYFSGILSRLAALAAALALAACVSHKSADISLAPVPYAMRVPKEIAPRLSTGPIEAPFRREVETAGARAATAVFFNPKDQNLPRSIFLTAYFFPASKFDAAQNPLFALAGWCSASRAHTIRFTTPPRRPGEMSSG